MSGDHLAQPSTQSRANLGQVAQSLARLNFECLQGWILCSLPRQPVPVLDHSHYEDFSLIIILYFPSCYLCPFCLICPLCTTEKSLAQLLHIRSLGSCKQQYGLLLAFLRLKNLSSLSLFLYVPPCSSPLITFIALRWTSSSLLALLVQRSPEWDTAFEMSFLSGTKGNKHFLQPAGYVFANTAPYELGFPDCKSFAVSKAFLELCDMKSGSFSGWVQLLQSSFDIIPVVSSSVNRLTLINVQC